MGGALIRRIAGLVSSLRLLRMILDRERIVVVCNWVQIVLLCLEESLKWLVRVLRVRL